MARMASQLSVAADRLPLPLPFAFLAGGLVLSHAALFIDLMGARCTPAPVLGALAAGVTSVGKGVLLE